MFSKVWPTSIVTYLACLNASATRYSTGHQKSGICWVLAPGGTAT